MCGRAVQSCAAITSAIVLLDSIHPNNECEEAGNENNNFGQKQKNEDFKTEKVDHWNLSPGMTFCILDKGFRSNCGSKSTWGLLTNSSFSSALSSKNQKMASLHFSNKMFNARSETVFTKKTFSKLAGQGNTCVVALDGFYEWKEDESNVVNNSNKKKQPYYVYRSDGLPLLVAGLYENHQTASFCKKDNDDSYKTFTLLTMSSCKDLCWLHHRQPVLFWDLELACQWIQQPTRSLLENDMTVSSTNDSNGKLAWHPVTKKMNQIQYQSADCIQPIRIDTIPSVKSFFTTTTKTKTPSFSRFSTGTKGEKNSTKLIKSFPNQISHKTTCNENFAKNDLHKEKHSTFTLTKPSIPSSAKISSKKTVVGNNDGTCNNGHFPQNSLNKKRQQKYSGISNVSTSKKGKITSFFRPQT